MLKRLSVLQIASIVIILAWLLPKFAVTYIEPDEIGVRRSWAALRRTICARVVP